MFTAAHRVADAVSVDATDPRNIEDYMTPDQDNFSSHMLRAFHSLTNAQLQLMNAQAKANSTSGEIEKAWDLLWRNIGCVVSLASVIQASESESGVIAAGRPGAQILERWTIPLVAPECAEFIPLVRSIQELMRAADRMRRHAANVFEKLIECGHGDSDRAFTVNMVRLYAQAVQSLVHTVNTELQPPQLTIAN